jgi:hypothetical protein
MKYAVEVGAGALIHITSCVNIGLGIQMLIGGKLAAWRLHK